jgi:hypothetical protein
LEQIGELMIVILVGALLIAATFAVKNITEPLLLFFAIRPLAIIVGLLRTPLGATEKSLIGWFGIRGMGSLYYLVYALQHGLPQSRMEAVANTVACGNRDFSCDSWNHGDTPDELAYAEASSQFVKPKNTPRQFVIEQRVPCVHNI